MLNNQYMRLAPALITAEALGEVERHFGVTLPSAYVEILEVARIFEADLKDVVAGTQWVDVPFDWGDYK